MEVPNYDGKWLFNKLRLSSDFKIVTKLYNGPYVANEYLTGFLCEALDLFGKPENKNYVLEKAKVLISNHGLPLIIEDLPYHEKRFKILIVKNVAG